MNFKLTFGFLCLVLTIQHNHGRSMPKVINTNLQQFIIDNLNKVAHIQLDDCKRMAEAVLADPLVLEHKTSVMDGYLEEFRQFLAHVKDFGDQALVSLILSPEAKKLIDEQKEVFDQFLVAEDDEGKVIKASLLRHEISNDLIKPTLSKFADDFVKLADEYLKTLDDAEKTSEADLTSALEKLKDETDFVNRLVIIKDYFEKSPKEAIL